MNDLTAAHVFLHQVLPPALFTLFAACGWYAICKLTQRIAERKFRDSMKWPEGYEQMPTEEKLQVMNRQRLIVGQGSPTDRLFLKGLGCSALLVALFFAAWVVGITPASKSEREFITLAEKSELRKNPSMKAALGQAGTALYISRRHFFAIEDSFRQIQN